MGGPGSGFRISKKTTVEDCLTLDINKLSMVIEKCAIFGHRKVYHFVTHFPGC